MIELLLSPSFKRSDRVTTHRTLPGVAYVVHEFEAAAYREAGHNIVVAPDSAKGNIARVRNWILDYAKAEGADRLLMVDDDIRAVREWIPAAGREGMQEKALTPEEVAEFIETAWIVAEEWGAPLWGLNVISDKGSYREYTPFSCKSYISGSWQGFPDLQTMAVRFDESIPLKEDLDFCLQILNLYRRTVRFNWLHMMKPDHEEVGGCATYRTIEVERRQLDAFRRKWGEGLVRIDSGASKVHRKKGKAYDLNPIIRAPIGGV